MNTNNTIPTKGASFSIIVAIAENNAIGKNGGMPWHISEDFKYFKRTTLGHNVIMGKNTWLSLPVKPLPGRKNIIISRTLNVEMDNVVVAPSIEKAVEFCDADSETFIIGGGRIYEQFLPLAHKLYITRVHAKINNADTFFPEIDFEKFKLISQSERFTDAKNNLQFTFEVYKKN